MKGNTQFPQLDFWSFEFVSLSILRVVLTRKFKSCFIGSTVIFFRKLKIELFLSLAGISGLETLNVQIP